MTMHPQANDFITSLLQVIDHPLEVTCVPYPSPFCHGTKLFRCHMNVSGMHFTGESQSKEGATQVAARQALEFFQ